MRIKVIIPVYNAQNYIEKCFDSILGQSFEDWEVIAVDDGSADNSLQLMQHYQKSDSRFKIIHQDNAGAGAARNLALQVCYDHPEEGYVVFVDADDYVEPDFFRLLSEHDEDIVFLDLATKDESGKTIGAEKMSVYCALDQETILRKQMTGCILWGGVRKAYREELLREHGIFYSTHRVGEEAVFSFLALYYAKSIGFIDQIVYSYVRHEGSLSSGKLDDPWGEVVMHLKEQIMTIGAYERFASSINAFQVSAAAVSLRRLAKNYGYKEYRSKALQRIALMQDRMDNSYPTDKESLRSAAKVMAFLMSVKWTGIIYLLGHLY